MLALLAFASLPAFAQAECTDSSCVNYGSETGKTHSGVPNEVKPTKENPLNEDGGEAHSSGGEHLKGSDGSEPQAEPETGEESTGEGEKQNANPGTPGGGDGNKPPSGGEGSPPKNQSSSGKTGVSDQKQLTTPGQNVAHTTADDGTSSPLVPILIAIAILAAISIGAVVYRQRRGDDGGSGSPVSPKAG